MRLKAYHLNYEIVSNEVPRIHQFNTENRIIKTVSLTALSRAANKTVRCMALYKRLKK